MASICAGLDRVLELLLVMGSAPCCGAGRLLDFAQKANIAYVEAEHELHNTQDLTLAGADTCPHGVALSCCGPSR